jgi:predicted ATPase
MDTVEEGESRVMFIRGGAGTGKTRMIEESAAEAERRGFLPGCGTALIDCVAPYHAWTDVLEQHGLSGLMKERPPPKILGLYCLDEKGGIASMIEREGEYSLNDAMSRLAGLLEGSGSASNKATEEGELSVLTEGTFRVLVHRGQHFNMGAILEGQEDEFFIYDLQELANTSHNSPRDLMQELMDSEKYEGIDYVKDDPRLRQMKLFGNLVLGLARKAKITPLLVAIDDLQWADPSSLALLQHVSKSVRESQILFLGTFRSEVEGTRPHLEEMMKTLEKEGRSTIMDLSGLSREDISELTTSFIGQHELPDRFFDSLWQETHGNPLFIREILLDLEDDEAIQMRGASKNLIRPLDELALPEIISKVIKTRLDRLPKNERLFLDAAATCGTRFTAALVAKVSGEDEDRVNNGLIAISESIGLLRPSGNGFVFDHPAVRETVYEQTPPESRQAYHQMLAEWLELTGGPVEDIAEHYSQAEDPRAVQMLQKVASSAKARYANAESERALHRALELTPENDTDSRRNILKNLGDLRRKAGDPEGAIAQFETALDLDDDPLKRSEILLKIAGTAMMRGEYQEALGTAKEALHTVGDQECKERANALGTIGNALYYQAQEEDAFEMYEQTLEIHERTGEDSSVAGVLHNMANIKMNNGEYQEALDLLYRALEISERLDNPFQERHLGSIGLVLTYQGKYHEAREYYERTRAIAEKLGDAGDIAAVIGNIGIVSMKLGDYQEAIPILEKSLKIFEDIGDPRGRAISLSTLGDTYREMKKFEKGRACYEESIEISQEIGVDELSMDPYLGLAHLSIDLGNLDAADSYCSKVLTLAAERKDRWRMAFAKTVLGALRREQKQWQSAIENLEEGLSLVRELGNEHDEGRVHYSLALAWEGAGDLAKKRQHLEAAIAIFERLDVSHDLDRAKAALARHGPDSDALDQPRMSDDQ